MRWEWDSGGDESVADLWHYREMLSRSGKVVYVKWYQGRATFFSKKAFTFLLAAFSTPKTETRFSTSDAKKIYELLDEHSPQSTKALKKQSDLRGHFYEATYQKCVKELFTRGLIVGWGEKDEGAFPSLQLGAAKHLFEEEWNAAKKMSSSEGQVGLLRLLKDNPKFVEFFAKTLRSSLISQT